MKEHDTVTMTYDLMKYPCIIKHCQHKQRNGRCSLTTIRFGYSDSGGTNYADCRDYLLQASIATEEPIHEFFELSYASYLVLPRSALQSMPVKWQREFVRLLNKMHEAFGDIPEHGIYRVELENDGGTTLDDPLLDYDRGRRRLPIKPKTTTAPQARFVQLLNPVTQRYVKVDRTRGAIISHKRTSGPYKGIPIITKGKTGRRGR